MGHRLRLKGPYFRLNHPYSSPPVNSTTPTPRGTQPAEISSFDKRSFTHPLRHRPCTTKARQQFSLIAASQTCHGSHRVHFSSELTRLQIGATFFHPLHSRRHSGCSLSAPNQSFLSTPEGTAVFSSALTSHSRCFCRTGSEKFSDKCSIADNGCLDKLDVREHLFESPSDGDVDLLENTHQRARMRAVFRP